MNHWDSSIMSYNDLGHIKKGGWDDVALPLQLLTAHEHYSLLASYAPALHEKLTRVVALRKERLDEMVKKDEPIAFEFLGELVNSRVGQNIAVHNTDGASGGRVVRAVYKKSWSGVYVELTYDTFVWRGGSLVRAQATFEAHGSSIPRVMSHYGIDLSPSSATVASLTERGRRVLSLNDRCAYINLVKNMWRHEFWRWVEVASMGRACVDQVGMSLFDTSMSQALWDDYDINERDDSKIAVDAVDPFLIDPYLAVFSMKTKSWGRAHVDSVADIRFRDDAFEKLVMPDDDKKLVYSLVKNTDPTIASDVVDNKGGGCTLLLHGEPGLGKTLTAEAVAETLRRPLYVVSVGELGTAPETLEHRLRAALDTAHRWNAVLLLDEADVFLEARAAGDVHRNAMVSTFLRLMEYYSGVLILTTNRVTDIDKAFYSRISLALQYGAFTAEYRHRITENLLALNGITLTTAEMVRLASININGRQLKNAIRQSRFLAKEEGRAVRVEDIMVISDRLQEFERQLAERHTANAERDRARLANAIESVGAATTARSGMMSRGGDAE
jgi:hypothetical protein